MTREVNEDKAAGLPAFAVKLKALREAAGLTQAQLAEKAGLHLGAIFKLEQGKREPAWETVQVIARALGVNCLAFSDESTNTPAKAAGKAASGRTAGKSGEEPPKGKKRSTKRKDG